MNHTDMARQESYFIAPEGCTNEELREALILAIDERVLIRTVEPPGYFHVLSKENVR